MKSEKEFDNILDECLERILTKGETIEQCLTSYSEWATELEPLLRTALSTKKTLAISPRPEFRERARYQLRAALQEMEEKRQRRFAFFSWQPRWVTAVVTVLILLLVSSGTVAAAGNSMPDETLYPVKLATENVRLVLTPSALGKAELYAKLADKRVTEIIKMADKGKLEQVERTAQRLNAQLVAMASLVGPPEEAAAVLTTPAPPEVAQEVAPVTEEPPEEKPGVALAPAPPAAKGPPEEKAEVQVVPGRPLPEEAQAIPSAPSVVPKEASTPQPVPSVQVAPEEAEPIKLDKRAKLREIVARNATKHQAVLLEVLKKVPESARPALLRAITESDAEYEKILEALEEHANDTEQEGETEVEHDAGEGDTEEEDNDGEE